MGDPLKKWGLFCPDLSKKNWISEVPKKISNGGGNTLSRNRPVFDSIRVRVFRDFLIFYKRVLKIQTYWVYPHNFFKKVKRARKDFWTPFFNFSRSAIHEIFFDKFRYQWKTRCNSRKIVGGDPNMDFHNGKNPQKMAQNWSQKRWFWATPSKKGRSFWGQKTAKIDSIRPPQGGFGIENPKKWPILTPKKGGFGRPPSKKGVFLGSKNPKNGPKWPQKRGVLGDPLKKGGIFKGFWPFGGYFLTPPQKGGSNTPKMAILGSLWKMNKYDTIYRKTCFFAIFRPFLRYFTHNFTVERKNVKNSCRL